MILSSWFSWARIEMTNIGIYGGIYINRDLSRNDGVAGLGCRWELYMDTWGIYVQGVPSPTKHTICRDLSRNDGVAGLGWK